MTGNNGWWRGNSGKFIIKLACLALLVSLFLNFFAQTPRDHMNIMQMVSVLFFLIIITRYGMARSSASSAQIEQADISGWRRELWVALLISAALYASILNSYFISDDYVHLFLARQPLIESLSYFLTPERGILRVLAFATINFDYFLWHHWQPGYHLTNLLFHFAGIIGIFYLCKNLALNLETAATAALIFSVMPIHPEAVVWPVNRFDVVATPLIIWAMVFYVNFRQTGRRWSYIWTLLIFLLAMHSKENAFVFPFLVIALEFFVLPKPRIKPMLGVMLLMIVTFCYRLAILGGLGGYRNSALSAGPKVFEGLFIRTPAQMLFGYNWLQPGSVLLVIIASLTAGLLLTLAFTVKPEFSSQTKRGTFWFSLVWIPLAGLPAHFFLLVGAGLTNSRVYYLSSAGAAVLIAVLINSIDPGSLRQGLKVALVLLLSLGLFHNLQAWQWTSKLSHRFLIELKQLEPSPPPGAEFLFRELPTTIRGVFFFNAGLEEAVNLTFDRQDLRARRVSSFPSKAEIQAMGRPIIEIDWEGSEERLIARPKD
jgi:hypothetical protein